MTNQEFNDIVHHMVGKIRENTPRRSGNLQKATTFKSLGADRFVIFVDTSEPHISGKVDGRAPYFKYVNNYEISKHYAKVGGKPAKVYTRNHHYNYWEKAVNLAIEDIAKALGGRVER